MFILIPTGITYYSKKSYQIMIDNDYHYCMMVIMKEQKQTDRDRLPVILRYCGLAVKVGPATLAAKGKLNIRFHFTPDGELTDIRRGSAA
jgi:hypothetical protein